MLTLTEQRVYLVEKGFTDEEATAYVRLKAAIEDEYDKCIKTLKLLKDILNEKYYKDIEKAFNNTVKKLDDGRRECNYKDLRTKISWYTNYMKSFRSGIRKIFGKDIF